MRITRSYFLRNVRSIQRNVLNVILTLANEYFWLCHDQTPGSLMIELQRMTMTNRRLSAPYIFLNPVDKIIFQDRVFQNG
jgi:hypothetical protein